MNVCQFSCKICFRLAEDPVVNVICNHLFCWRCIYSVTSFSSSEPQRQGSGKGCPFCKSHLDISSSKSTIIPVCSGPKPGIDFALIDEPQIDEDEEAEESLKRLIQKEGKEYVPNRPLWEGKAVYVSKHDLIKNMMFAFLYERKDWKHYWPDMICLASDLYQLPFPTPNRARYVSSVSHNLYKMIQELKDGWEWLTGDKYPNEQSDLEICINPNKTENSHLQFTLVPSDTKFPGVSAFACKICGKIAYEPVANACSHLFCWTCLRSTGNGSSKCPICDRTVNFYSSRASINPIYCSINEHMKEDDFLKSNRKYFTEVETQTPRRHDQTVVVPFLRYMIRRISGDAKVTLKLVDNLWSDTSHEDIEGIISAVTSVWDKLHVDLVKNWRIDSGEHVAEHLIRPTFLIYETITKKFGDEERVVYSGYIDIFGDKPDA